MALEYYEDIKIHQKWRSSGYLLTEQKIVSFGEEWDPDPLHVDSDFAKTSTFGGLIAPGTLLLSILVRQPREREPKAANSVVLGWDEIRFLAPGRPGDVQVAETQAISKRESQSDPKVGIVHYIIRLLNQHDEPVITLKAVGFSGKHPKA